LDELYVASGFNDLAGDFVAQYEALRRCGAAADHVLVAAADVGGNDFEDDAMLAFTRSEGEFGVVDALDFDFRWSHVGDLTIACHTDVSVCELILGSSWPAQHDDTAKGPMATDDKCCVYCANAVQGMEVLILRMSRGAGCGGSRSRALFCGVSAARSRAENAA